MSVCGAGVWKGWIVVEKTARVSVIVPVYNVEKYVERCIRSLLRQSYPNYEIILIDDCSPDRSGSICDEFNETESLIKVIHHKERGGLSAARNSGIKAASGEYITFVDSDDFVTEDFLSRLVELAVLHDCGIVQCGYEKGSEEWFSDKPVKTNVAVLGSAEALLGYRLKSQACCKLYKAKLFDGIMFPPGVIHEDEFVTYKLVYKCGRIAITGEPLYYYYQHKSSIMGKVTTSRQSAEHELDWVLAYKERLKFFEEKNDIQQIYKTYEKICTDIILKYVEMKKAGENRGKQRRYKEEYKKCYKMALRKKGIAPERICFYTLFRFFPEIVALIFQHDMRR